MQLLLLFKLLARLHIGYWRLLSARLFLLLTSGGLLLNKRTPLPSLATMISFVQLHE